jgi:hypothetical protein
MYTVYDPIHDHERPDWAEPAPVALTAYLNAMLACLPAELQPEHRDDATFAGFSLGWNAPDAWPYGVGVVWDGNLGWRYLEGGLRIEPLPMFDELVPYPEFVAQVVDRLLNDGPAGLPVFGATRWPQADALIASLETTS